MSLALFIIFGAVAFALGRITAGPWIADDDTSAWCDCVDRDLDERGL